MTELKVNTGGPSLKPEGQKITPYMWVVLFVCLMGYVFDSYEVMLYSNALPDIAKEMHFNFAAAGSVMTLSLLGYAFGGMFWGPMTDRIGRMKVMMYTVGGYAIFTGLTALAWSPMSLITFRFLMGFMAGGEWAAGASMITETWPANRRGAAIAVMQAGWPTGAMLAALVYGAIAPQWGWRWVFVTGILPALIVLLIRFNLKESEHFIQQKATGTARASWVEIFAPRYLKRTVMFILISFIGLLGYWTVMTWIPTMLRTQYKMTIFATSMWFVTINIGGIVGYLLFGPISDRIGRRPTFTIFWLTTMISVPLFAFYARTPSLMLPIGLALGMATGYFSGYPAYGSELWPTKLRGSGMGIAYTGIARIGSTFGPMAVGIMAQSMGIGAAISIIAACFILAVIFIWTLGFETRGKSLEELDLS